MVNRNRLDNKRNGAVKTHGVPNEKLVRHFTGPRNGLNTITWLIESGPHGNAGLK